MKDLVIYGAGGLGKEVVGLINAINERTPTWKIVGFLDDDSQKSEWFGYEVLGDVTFLQSHPEMSVVIAIGNPEIKKDIAEKLPENVHLPSLIHPLAVLQNFASIQIGDGCLITAGCILTCDIFLNDHILLNLNTTIGHDAHLGKYSSVMCGVNIAGGVACGKEVFIGSGANILNGINLGDNARIGAGAVVTKDVLEDTTVAGVPAKPL